MSLTGKTGKYQDEVPVLPGLPLNRYERIFKLFTEKPIAEQVLIPLVYNFFLMIYIFDFHHSLILNQCFNTYSFV